MTPGATNEALAKQADPNAPPTEDAGPPAPPLVMPTDICTEAELAASMKMTKASMRKLLESQAVQAYPMPKGTRVVAMDSAKQTHYLPAILGVQAWFGSTADCVEAACTGRWQGGLT
jgi:hypothetical protein